MSDYYDRQGNPITTMEWVSSFENFDEKVVRQETLPNGKWVSTVWLGLNHQFGDGPPLIFESMVFPAKPDGPPKLGERDPDRDELEQRRYSTEEEALAGHAELVKRWSE